MSGHIESTQIRITGPYEHRTGEYRCRIIIDGRREWAPTADSPQRAKRLAQLLADRYSNIHPVTVGATIERYRQHLIDKGNKPASFQNTPLRLRRFFAPVLDSPLASLTERRCQALYDELRQQISAQTARPLAVDTHRAYLADGRSFGTWVAKTKLLKTNPLAAIEGVGRRSHGKPQLRHNEARRLSELCFARAADDDGALAVLVAVLMGLRAGEIVSRTARDLDDAGRILWVDDVEDWSPKTAAARRRVEVPALLQPLLLARIQDKLPAALLFPNRRGARHDRGWVRKEARRLCLLAGVPVVCAHSLRGFHATAAIAAGASPHIVAAALGHESASITMTSYAAPGSAELASRRRTVAALLPARP